MKINDVMYTKGSVRPEFVNLATGRTMSWDDRHNTLTYSASMAMAAAFGGDPRHIPNRIGFIYGSGDSSQESVSTSFDRNQTWESLRNDLGDDKDVQIRPFSYSPSMKTTEKTDSSSSSSSSSDVDAKFYSVTFHACSDSQTPGAIHPDSGKIFTADMRVYQAVLLNVTGDDKTVLARVSLADGGTYKSKPKDFEIALDWTIKFF